MQAGAGLGGCPRLCWDLGPGSPAPRCSSWITGSGLGSNSISVFTAAAQPNPGWRGSPAQGSGQGDAPPTAARPRHQPGVPPAPRGRPAWAPPSPARPRGGEQGEEGAVPNPRGRGRRLPASIPVAKATPSIAVPTATSLGTLKRGISGPGGAQRLRTARPGPVTRGAGRHGGAGPAGGGGGAVRLGAAPGRSSSRRGGAGHACPRLLARRVLLEPALWLILVACTPPNEVPGAGLACGRMGIPREMRAFLSSDLLCSSV